MNHLNLSALWLQRAATTTMIVIIEYYSDAPATGALAFATRKKNKTLASQSLLYTQTSTKNGDGMAATGN